jgi:hypothetical protein
LTRWPRCHGSAFSAGPWTIRGEFVFQCRRGRPGGDPRLIRIAASIDLTHAVQRRAGLVGSSIDALGLEPGNRVMHIGGGTSYYTALMAHTVGPSVPS